MYRNLCQLWKLRKRLLMKPTLFIHFDGSCYHKDGRMGMGFALFEGESTEPIYTEIISSGDLKGTSNEAEYRALTAALTYVSTNISRLNRAYSKIIIYGDSQVVINQMIGDYEPRSLLHHYNWVCHILDKIDHYISIEFGWVPRDNVRQTVVDQLSKKGNKYYLDK